MKRHRIGRVQEPWTNLVPPIRSPNYREQIQLAKETNVTEKRHRRRRSLEVAVQGLLRPHLSTSTVAIPEVKGVRDPGPELSSSTKKRNDLSTKSEWKKDHAVTLEESEIAESRQNWPALDAATQRSIVLEYRALHDEIKARGLYTCRYSNYGVESIRYGLLFAAFLYLLSIKWYLSSAVFLGLFWVSG